MADDLGKRRTGFSKGDHVTVAHPYDVSGEVVGIVLTTGELIVDTGKERKLFVKNCFCKLKEGDNNGRSDQEH